MFTLFLVRTKLNDIILYYSPIVSFYLPYKCDYCYTEIFIVTMLYIIYILYNIYILYILLFYFDVHAGVAMV